MKIICSILVIFSGFAVSAQQPNYVSKVWVADNGDGTYKNPVLHADYSDPDAIRVGEDYYMTASSFDAVPGLPVLHSKDLVNWKIIGHALPRQIPFDHFSKTQHGNGVWAPAIRYHNNRFYIYYPDPDFGIYLVTAKNAAGPWSEPVMVEAGKGLIDPCPLWDDNGNAYLVHAYAGSRAGIKSIVVIKKMNKEGTKTTDAGTIVYDGHETDPTIEGPKLYKRNGWYYIFAPAGGVATGWQLVLRSKNIYGPYERKVVMDQGKSPINGPHQGAWVNTPSGEDWFLHFQDKEAYGRVMHLQPVQWKNDWPVIGEDKDGDGKGEPVLQYKKPATGRAYPKMTPAESDEFNTTTMGLQWQWPANPVAYRSFLTGNSLRLYAMPVADTVKNYWEAPHLLLQKFPAEQFTATTKISFKPKLEKDKCGLMVMGLDYAYLSIEKRPGGNYLSFSSCNKADKGSAEITTDEQKLPNGEGYLRVQVAAGAVCTFSYSIDGAVFKSIGKTFTAQPGKWIGAKLGLFCSSSTKTNDMGYADIDWFRIDK